MKLKKPFRASFFATLALAAALFAALSVSPAAAGTAHADAEFCGVESPMFSALSALEQGSGARGENTVREPQLNQIVEELPASAKGKAGSSFVATIPVWFHVVHANGVGNIPQRIIDRQMTVLNLAFGGFYGGVDTGFRFQLAGVTRTDNAVWYTAGPTTQGERDMKTALRRGGWNTLNLYSTTAGAYLGWAYFPGLPDCQQYLDGIVVDWESMPKASRRYEDAYDLGQTATHEAGHWLHLHHVFNGGCNNWGDYVDDTPPQRIATFGCPIGQDSCREPGLDSIHNYMDYSFDSCYDQFTAGQAQRMKDAWLFFRANG